MGQLHLCIFLAVCIFFICRSHIFATTLTFSQALLFMEGHILAMGNKILFLYRRQVFFSACESIFGFPRLETRKIKQVYAKYKYKCKQWPIQMQTMTNINAKSYKYKYKQWKIQTQSMKNTNAKVTNANANNDKSKCTKLQIQMQTMTNTNAKQGLMTWGGQGCQRQIQSSFWCWTNFHSPMRRHLKCTLEKRQTMWRQSSPKMKTAKCNILY